MPLIKFSHLNSIFHPEIRNEPFPIDKHNSINKTIIETKVTALPSTVKIMNKFLFLVLPVLALFSCDATKKTGQDTMQPVKTMTEKAIPVNITFKRGPCMGKCPVFTLQVEENGAATLLGARYARLEGENTKSLTAAEVTELQKIVADAKFMSLDDRYDSGILDAPSTTMIVKSAKGEKTIVLRGTMPDVLKPLVEKMDAIYNSEGWTATETKSNNRFAKSFSYSQGPCFGQCPVYTLDIKPDGIAHFEGKRFATKQGKYTKTVTDAEVAELVALFDAAGWFKLENKYDSKITDIPSIFIKYRNGDMIKKINFRGETPEGVKAIMSFFSEMADSKGWTKIASNDYGLPAGTIANELIVKLKRGVDVNEFVRSYIKQDMKLKKTIAPTMNMHLVTFDPNTSTPQEMIMWVREREDVETAEFNKEVNVRED